MPTRFFVPEYRPYEPIEHLVEERRSGRRHFVDWPVLIETVYEAGTPFRDAGTLRDISSSGAFAYIIGHMTIGRRLKVSIKLPLGKEVWMCYTAQVVRLERADLGIGIALRFDDKRPSFGTIKHEASYS
jgi:hypothetical protein